VSIKKRKITLPRLEVECGEGGEPFICDHRAGGPRDRTVVSGRGGITPEKISGGERKDLDALLGGGKKPRRLTDIK